MAKRVLHDEYFNRAKREGYLARSAFKLLELEERKKLVRRGGRVLDLGCAPGSWLQVAAELAGPRGEVVGVDLTEVDTRTLARPGKPAAAITALVADIREIDLASLGDEPFDCVLSDMAPNTSGAGDHFLSVRLCERVLEVADRVLRPGGNLAMKVFEGEAFPQLVRNTGRAFADAKAFKPRACRSVSSETYIVGKKFRGPRGRPGQATRRPPAPPTGW